MLRSILRFASAAGLVAVAFASMQCSVIASADLGAGIGVKCAADGDCQGGICDRGVCSSQCTTDADCPKPSACISNRCRLGCKDDSTCSAGTICDANACRAGCREDSQCNAAAGEICDKAGSLTCKPGCRGTGVSTCGAGKICKADVCVAGCVDDKGCGSGLICIADQCKAGCRPKELATKGCPAGQFCEAGMPDTVGSCKPSIQVGAIVPGKTDGSDAWSTSHRIALDDASKITPYLYFKDKPYDLAENLKKLPEIQSKIDDYAGRGANAVIVTSPAGYEAAYTQAPKHPGVKFIAIGARDNRSLPNVASYRTNTDAGWYVSGRLAGRIVAPTTAKCIGLILPHSGRQVVREANAFIMGARKQVSDVKVVIRWLGAGSDPDIPQYTFTSASGFYSTPTGVKLNREELLTAQLADLGCAVIAHHTETQRSVAFIEKTLKGPFKSQFSTSLFSLATDLEFACHEVPLDGSSPYRTSCAGSLYANWAPQYVDIFNRIKGGTWEARSNFISWKAGADAVFKLKEHKDTASVLGVPATEIQGWRFEMQNNPEYVFSPEHHSGIKFIGQRDLDKNGLPDAKQEVFSFEEPLSEINELDRMCWFVQGAFEFPACAEVRGAESVRSCNATLASLVPALVPYGPRMDATSPTCAARADKCASTMTSAAADRAKYADVIDFIRLSAIAGDPTTQMDCPTN